jgi:predicted phosphoribosyltransferase
MSPRLKNRREAGKKLSQLLEQYAGRKDTLVLALPRGGVPVGYEVAKALALPLDVWIVRKLGVPGHEELAMGAIALGGDSYIDHSLVRNLMISENDIEKVLVKEIKELQRRNMLYRDNKPPPDVENKTVILIDDGLATGSTMRAAIQALREAGAYDIIAAVPVGSPSACAAIGHETSKAFCLYEAEPFYGVGMWYEDFSQTSDEEVQALLANQPWINALEKTP